MNPAVAEGIRLFNAQKFFEAHEALEAVWLTEQGDEKLFLHGLIQVAAAFHHYQRGNWQGFGRVLARGARKLAKFTKLRDGIDVLDLRGQLRPWLEFCSLQKLSAFSAGPPLPRIRIRGDDPRL
jgi:predicted metal-dependent hydrolase